MSEKRWEQLGENVGVYVSNEHTFNTDTLLLAQFSMPKAHDACLDIGTGAGVIPTLWKMRAEAKKIYGVEIQQKAAEMAAESVKKNGFTNVEIIHADVKDRPLPHQSLDLIACNPPYKVDGTGLKNSSESRKLARHDETLSTAELAKAATYMLKTGGRLCICQRPERLADIMQCFRENKLEPKRIRFVQQKIDSDSKLFLLEARRDGGVGLKVEAALIIEDENGEYTDEMKEIYGEYYLKRGKQ